MSQRLNLDRVTLSIQVEKMISDNRVLIIFICLVNFIVIYAGDKTVFTEEFYLDLLQSGNYSESRIQEIRQFNLQLGWVFHAAAPLLMVIKFFIISGALYLIVYLREISVSFNNVLRTVALAELVFIMEEATRIIWFGNLSTGVDEFYYISFSPLSLANIIDPSVIVENVWLVMPLRLINVFQVLYIFILAWMLMKPLKKNLWTTLAVVAPVYLVLFVFYVAGTMAVNTINHV